MKIFVQSNYKDYLGGGERGLLSMRKSNLFHFFMLKFNNVVLTSASYNIAWLQLRLSGYSEVMRGG